MHSLERIVSGGQTGADRAALDAAIRLGLPHGGWCPAGRRAEDGSIPAHYHLTETPSRGYTQRTRWNIRDSDGTVVFTLAHDLKGGSLMTWQYARRIGKPCLHLCAGHPAATNQLRDFVAAHGIHHLNVAGSRESREPGIHAWTLQLICRARCTDWKVK